MIVQSTFIDVVDLFGNCVSKTIFNTQLYHIFSVNWFALALCWCSRDGSFCANETYDVINIISPSIHGNCCFGEYSTFATNPNLLTLEHLYNYLRSKNTNYIMFQCGFNVVSS